MMVRTIEQRLIERVRRGEDPFPKTAMERLQEHVRTALANGTLSEDFGPEAGLIRAISKAAARGDTDFLNRLTGRHLRPEVR